MEFKLTSPQTFVQVIEFNYDDLQQWITEQVQNYQNLVYTDETIKNAKEDRAKLNKFRESIDAARKDVKKRYLEPYENFEAKVKDLLKLIEEPTKAIDTQVKAYEEKTKEAKRIEIESYYNANIGDLATLLSFEKIFNSKWLNATVTMKSVETEIDNIIAKVKFDIATIKDLKSEWELTLLDTYLNTLDISTALREKTRLEERKAELEKQESKVEAKVETPENFEKDINVPIKNETVAAEVKTYTRKFWVQGTKEQLIALGDYMKANGISYGGIE